MARISRRPSPATVIACIALFVSLGGVGYAAATGSIDSRELKNNSVRSKDIRNSTVTSTDIRNSTVRGGDVRGNTLTGSDINESSLGKVPSATNADTAANAGTLDGRNSTDFGPRAFARINGAAATGGDTIVDSLSQGITDANVTHPQNGVYCFVDLGFTPRNVVATIDVNDSPGGAGNVDTIYTHTTTFGVCGNAAEQARTRAAVRTRNNGTAANRSFFVVIH